MTQAYWTPERRRLAKAFAIAPAVPIVLMAVLSLPAGILILVVALPVAYVCALVVGLPIYQLLKRFRLMGWPYFIIGGVICSVPGMLLFYKDNAHYVYSLQMLASFAALGGIGGIIFWWLAIRSPEGMNKYTFSNIPGYVLLFLALGVAGYVYAMGRVEYTEGTLSEKQHPFVSEEDTWVSAIIKDGSLVKARLPAGIPYRAKCAVGLAVWRDLFSHEFVYSISYYPDAPFAHHYQWLKDEKKNEITHACI